MVFWLLRVLTQETVIALAVALIFGVHPVQIESVVWVAERKNLLSGFLFLASLLAYVACARSAYQSKHFLLLSWVLFLAACLAKPSVIVLPLLLLVLDLTYGEFKKRNHLRYLPFLAISVVFGLLTIWIVHRHPQMEFPRENFLERALVMLVVIMRYLELLFFPVRLSLLYEFPNY